MIPLVRVTVGLKREGPGAGYPMAFILLGGTNGVETEDVMEQSLKLVPKRGWISIFGDEFDPLGMGVGTLVRGLSHFQRYVEVCTGGFHRDPNWFRSCDRWIVDLQQSPSFNYKAMRSCDSLRLRVTEDTDLEEVYNYLVACSKFACEVFLTVPAKNQKLVQDTFSMAVDFSRVRIFFA